MTIPDPPWKQRTRPCPFYSQGRCLFADSCSFLHDVKIKVRTQDIYVPLNNRISIIPALEEPPSEDTSPVTSTPPRKRLSVRESRRSPRLSSLLLALGDVIEKEAENEEILPTTPSSNLSVPRSPAQVAFGQTNTYTPTRTQPKSTRPSPIVTARSDSVQFEDRRVSVFSPAHSDEDPEESIAEGLAYEDEDAEALSEGSVIVSSLLDPSARTSVFVPRTPPSVLSILSDTVPAPAVSEPEDKGEPLGLLSPIEITLPFPSISSALGRLPSPPSFSNPCRDDSIDSGYAEDNWVGPAPLALSPPKSPNSRRVSTFDFLYSPFGSPFMRVISPKNGPSAASGWPMAGPTSLFSPPSPRPEDSASPAKSPKQTERDEELDSPTTYAIEKKRFSLVEMPSPFRSNTQESVQDDNHVTVLQPDEEEIELVVESDTEPIVHKDLEAGTESVTPAVDPLADADSDPVSLSEDTRTVQLQPDLLHEEESAPEEVYSSTPRRESPRLERRSTSQDEFASDPYTLDQPCPLSLYPSEPTPSTSSQEEMDAESLIVATVTPARSVLQDIAALEEASDSPAAMCSPTPSTIFSFSLSPVIGTISPRTTTTPSAPGSPSPPTLDSPNTHVHTESSHTSPKEDIVEAFVPEVAPSPLPSLGWASQDSPIVVAPEPKTPSVDMQGLVSIAETGSIVEPVHIDEPVSVVEDTVVEPQTQLESSEMNSSNSSPGLAQTVRQPSVDRLSSSSTSLSYITPTPPQSPSAPSLDNLDIDVDTEPPHTSEGEVAVETAVPDEIPSPQPLLGWVLQDIPVAVALEPTTSGTGAQEHVSVTETALVTESVPVLETVPTTEQVSISEIAMIESGEVDLSNSPSLARTVRRRSSVDLKRLSCSSTSLSYTTPTPQSPPAPSSVNLDRDVDVEPPHTSEVEVAVETVVPEVTPSQPLLGWVLQDIPVAVALEPTMSGTGAQEHVSVTETVLVTDSVPTTEQVSVSEVVMTESSEVDLSNSPSLARTVRKSSVDLKRLSSGSGTSLSYMSIAPLISHTLDTLDTSVHTGLLHTIPKEEVTETVLPEVISSPQLSPDWVLQDTLVAAAPEPTVPSIDAQEYVSVIETISVVETVPVVETVSVVEPVSIAKRVSVPETATVKLHSPSESRKLELSDASPSLVRTVRQPSVDLKRLSIGSASLSYSPRTSTPRTPSSSVRLHPVTTFTPPPLSQPSDSPARRISSPLINSIQPASPSEPHSSARTRPNSLYVDTHIDPLSASPTPISTISDIGPSGSDHKRDSQSPSTRVPFGFRRTGSVRSAVSSRESSIASLQRVRTVSGRHRPPALVGLGSDRASSASSLRSGSGGLLSPVDVESVGSSSRLRPLRLSTILNSASSEISLQSQLSSSSAIPSLTTATTATSYIPISPSPSVASEQSISHNRSLSLHRSSLIPAHVQHTHTDTHLHSHTYSLLDSSNPDFSPTYAAPLSAPVPKNRFSLQIQQQPSRSPSPTSVLASRRYSHIIRPESRMSEPIMPIAEDQVEEHEDNEVHVDKGADETIRVSTISPIQHHARRDSLLPSHFHIVRPTSVPPSSPKPPPSPPHAIATPRPNLLFAIASASPSAVQRVLESGEANPNEDVGPQSALEFALTAGGLGRDKRREVVKMLLKHGADPGALNLNRGEVSRHTSVALSANGSAMDKGKEAGSPAPAPALDALANIDPATRYYISRAAAPQTRRASALIHRSFFRPLTKVRYDMVGQDRALEQLFRVLGMPRAGVVPIVVLLCGPSGHGKSLLARKFGSLLDVPTHTVNMTTLQSTHDIWRSYSMSPYEAPSTSTLSNFLLENEGKRCVVVLDEIEKVEDQKFLSSLLVPWELGRCSFEAGQRHVDVSKVIWLGTSNVGHDLVFEHQKERANPEEAMTREEYVELMSLLRPKVSERLGPSLLSRVTTVLPFVPFSAEEKMALAAEALSTLAAEAFEGDQELPPATMERLVKSSLTSYVPEEGARSLYRAVSSLLLDVL